MGMTQAQLLASLGVREITGNRQGVFRAVEDPAQGIRITGEVFCSALPDSVLVQLTHQEASKPAGRMCGLRADLVNGSYVVTGFEVGGIEYRQDGRWCFFNEDSACGFVRAVMQELEAKRLPDLDALLTVAGGPDRFITIDWRP